MKKRYAGINAIVPQIMLILAGGFLLLFGLQSTFYQVLMEDGKFVEKTPLIKLLYIAVIVLFGVGFLLLGTLFKKALKRRLEIFIILSMLYMFFFGGFMYYFIFIQPPQITDLFDSGDHINPVVNYMYLGIFLFIQVVPIIVIGVHIRRYEKKVRHAEDNIELKQPV